MSIDGRISAPVGRNGKNFAPDVLVVQRLLMARLGSYGPLRPFAPDGICGPQTIEAIMQFQRNAVRMLAPDGRVDPNGKTFAALVGGIIGAAAGPAGGGQARSLSQAGRDFISRHEGCVLKLYDDAAKFATIGYGHLVHRGPVGTNPTAEAPYLKGISKAEALLFLQRDAAIHVAAVKSAIRTPLLQNQFDALVSLSFNIGSRGLRSSTLVRIINQGGYTAEQIRAGCGMWSKVKGVVQGFLESRRSDEANLFNEGTY